MLLATILLISCALSSHGENVIFTHDGASHFASWDNAGADFQPTIDAACSQFAAFDSCATALLDALIAADLRLWNARDGKNLTWQQRPPRLMPQHLQDKFTLGGAVDQLQSYTDQSQPGCEIHQEYSSDDIAAFIDKVRSRAYGPSYPEVDYHIYRRKPNARAFVNHSIMYVTCHAVAESGSLGVFLDARVIVFGSIRPWYESVAIALGAKYVATVEYAPLNYDYNRNGVRIETFKPNDASLARLKSSFDVAISISSFEHDGLGR
jgi:hypothetical protein